MKTVSAMEVRRHLGELLDEVRLKSETIVIERQGRPMARLCPVQDAAAEAEVERRLRVVREAAGRYASTARAEDAQKWVDTERGEWERGS